MGWGKRLLSQATAGHGNRNEPCSSSWADLILLGGVLRSTIAYQKITQRTKRIQLGIICFTRLQWGSDGKWVFHHHAPVWHSFSIKSKQYICLALQFARLKGGGVGGWKAPSHALASKSGVRRKTRPLSSLLFLWNVWTGLSPAKSFSSRQSKGNAQFFCSGSRFLAKTAKRGKSRTRNDA